MINYILPVISLIFWTVTFVTAQSSQYPCKDDLIKIAINAEGYKKIAASYNLGSVIAIDSQKLIFNLGYLEVFLLDGGGHVLKRIDQAQFDSIADLHTLERHGKEAIVKRKPSALDSLFCSSNDYSVRGITLLETSNLIRIEYAVIVENIEVREGRGFENTLFTIDVDYDLNICSSALIKKSRLLFHSLSLINGAFSTSTLIQQTKTVRGNPNEFLFLEYSLVNGHWELRSPITDLKLLKSNDSRFLTVYPGGIRHKEGSLFSNGKEVVVLDENGETLKRWEIKDYDKRALKKVVAYNDEFIAINYALKGVYIDPDKKYYVVEYLNQDFSSRKTIARYDLGRYRVNDIFIKDNNLYTLFFDKKSQTHLIHITDLLQNCEMKIYNN